MSSSRAGVSSGIVYLVGAGPGDPGLLTVRARELLRDCDAIVHDALANPQLIATALAERDIPPELHGVGKRGGEASARQADITAVLVRLASEGKRVVRLKGGDPLVFGRGSEEAQALSQAGISFELVPGVTAGIAAPAYAGIPVTHRGVVSSVIFVTGHEDPIKDSSLTDWSALARAGGTIVLYMGVGRLRAVTEALAAGGMDPDTPAAIIEWGTYPKQRTVVATLGTLAERAMAEAVGAPAITVIGDVVRLRNEIRWYDRRPLFGRRIVVTRSRAQASDLSSRLRELGAHVLEVPIIRIETLDDTSLGATLERLPEYQWVIFTSQNAVSIVWQALRARGRDARAFAAAKLCAIGPATAEALSAVGLMADLIPDRFVAEGVVEALRRRADEVRGARVLLMRAAEARELIPDELRSLGASVDDVPIYRSVPDGQGAGQLRSGLERGEIDLVTFTSSSTVRYYVDAVGASRAVLAPGVSIGPVTSRTARECGIRIVAEARESTIAGLVEALVAAAPQ